MDLMKDLRYEKIHVNGYNKTVKEILVDGVVQSKERYNQKVSFYFGQVFLLIKLMNLILIYKKGKRHKSKFRRKYRINRLNTFD